ncbi:CarD family transcriptional regulator [Rhodococcus sp. Z13]|uniref:CarD family transcriptional regulator n=1 Tax=Rhodococcus sacchari TaxID=2962047 RepID=A0ACD4DJ46_9NOCA|nr:CarD family transcriptional regulator [Rhodococcus sp. Z13]UYP19990.1 CarD family transcriptional regulator [Rhodococcus sp. Z13]
MQFSTGQIVVHPHHGPATVAAITTRTIKQQPVSYLQLKVHSSDLTVALPLDKAEEIGLRDVYSSDELKKLFEILHTPTDHEEETWSRRFKENQDRLRSGDLHVTAAVVRDLTRREHRKGLSMGERTMLKAARTTVLTELCLGLSLPEEQAEQMLDSAIMSSEPTASEREVVALG